MTTMQSPALPPDNHESRHHRAVAYYRSGSDDSAFAIRRQRDHVRRWADEHEVTIIREFVDRGEEARCQHERPAFQQLLGWIRERHDFHYVLCHEMTRWNRFRDLELLKKHGVLCELHRKRLLFTAGAPAEDSPLYADYRAFQRCCAAEYSRRLSRYGREIHHLELRVFRGEQDDD